MPISILSNFKEPNKIEALFIGTFEIDVTLTEEHSFTNTITQYNIEDGADVSDMVKQTPYTLQLSGLTSNTPINYINGRDKLEREDLTNRTQIAFNKLISMAGYQPPKVGDRGLRKSTVKYLTIFSKLLVYTDMVISNIRFTRDNRTGDALVYAITFQHMGKVKALYKVEAIAPINNAEKQGTPKIDKGKVDKKVPSVKEQSLLSKGVKKIETYVKKVVAQ